MSGWLIFACLAAGTAPPLETIACPKLAAPIVIDGVVDEAWAAVPPNASFRIWGSPEEEPTYKTTVRIAFDDDYLYFLFDCADSDIYCLYESRDAYLWESDVVELFLVPDPGKPLYYEFQVAPNGALFDARFVSRGGGDFRRWAQWDAPMEAAVDARGTLNDWTDTDDGYTVECRIPWSAFADATGGTAPAGETWAVAAARADFSVALEREERSATANLVKGDPHTEREGYFSLRFDANAAP